MHLPYVLICLVINVFCHKLTDAFMDLNLNAIKDGLDTFAKLVESVELAGKECIYKCPAGFYKSVNNLHTPTSNGCGSLGVDVDLSHLPTLNSCCDEHDICYDTCKKNRDDCDKTFHKCLVNSCTSASSRKQRKQGAAITIDACKITAEVVYQGVTAFGCKSYLDAQRAACTCVPLALYKEL